MLRAALLHMFRRVSFILPHALRRRVCVCALVAPFSQQTSDAGPDARASRVGPGERGGASPQSPYPLSHGASLVCGRDAPVSLSRSSASSASACGTWRPRSRRCAARPRGRRRGCRQSSSRGCPCPTLPFRSSATLRLCRRRGTPAPRSRPLANRRARRPHARERRRRPGRYRPGLRRPGTCPS